LLFDITQVKLLSWNIRQGGGTRLACIVEEIAAHDADLIALTEYRTAPGMELCPELGERGWPHVKTTLPTGRDRCLLAYFAAPYASMPGRS
jgi:hypothetical protein